MEVLIENAGYEDDESSSEGRLREVLLSLESLYRGGGAAAEDRGGADGHQQQDVPTFLQPHVVGILKRLGDALMKTRQADEKAQLRSLKSLAVLIRLVQGRLPQFVPKACIYPEKFCLPRCFSRPSPRLLLMFVLALRAWPR